MSETKERIPYKEPELTVVELDGDDIIATSDGSGSGGKTPSEPIETEPIPIPPGSNT